MNSVPMFWNAQLTVDSNHIPSMKKGLSGRWFNQYKKNDFRNAFFKRGTKVIRFSVFASDSENIFRFFCCSFVREEQEVGS